jgi:hypothetical protein
MYGQVSRVLKLPLEGHSYCRVGYTRRFSCREIRQLSGLLRAGALSTLKTVQRALNSISQAETHLLLISASDRLQTNRSAA